MLRIEQKLSPDACRPHPQRGLRLRYADRCKSRLRVVLNDGAEAGLFLARGSVLHGGDVLLADDGSHILVEALAEELYEVEAGPQSPDPGLDLLRAAYHLGNRHVPVELLRGHLRLERDPVLRDLLLRLALSVREVAGPFEPEAGVYGGGHRHDRDHAGGSLGERLSREAHAVAPNFSSFSFTRSP